VIAFIWLWPTLAILGALGLMACSRREPSGALSQYLLPAVRTVALITVAGLYVAVLFQGTPS
jgi:hypothetical protein